METTVVKSNESVAVRFKIKKDSVENHVPVAKNLVLIHEMYQCNSCYKIFNEIENLSSHGCTVKKDDVECSASSQENCPPTSSPDVQPDPNEKRGNFVCDVCNLSFPFRSIRRAHYTIHRRRYKCRFCGEIFRIRNTFRKHLRRHEYAIPIKCDDCNKEFPTKTELKKHRQQDHAVKQIYQCHLCNKICSTNNHLRMHFKIHTGKLYSCDICNRKYAWEKMLDRHYEKVHINKAYQCHHCEKSFKDSGNLKRHMRSHTLTKPYPCSICNQSFSRSDNLKKHHMSIHSDDRPYSCEICDKRFAQKASLERHNVTHDKTGLLSLSLNLQPREKKFCCDRCGKCFSSNTHLKMHFRLHTGERPYKCDICNKTFRIKHTWKNHKLVHTDIRVACEVCDKLFVTKQSLKKHMKVHSGEFTCYDCGKCFSTAGNLKDHTVVHTKEKPFECKECGKCFSNRWTLSKHKVVHTAVDNTESSDVFVAEYSY